MMRAFSKRAGRTDATPYYFAAHDGTVRTYGWVTEQSLRIAQDLHQLAAVDTVVSCVLHEAQWLLPALLACWRVGAIPALCDPTEPEARWRRTNEILQSTAILTDRRAAVPHDVCPVIDVTTAAPTMETPPHWPDPHRDPWLLLFSSGSTGQPKCIPLSLENLVANIEAYGTALGLSAADRFFCASPHWYAHGCYNSFLTAWWLGAGVIHTAPLRLDTATQALEAARTHHATIAHLSPAMLPVLRTIATRRPDLRPTWRHAVCGTSALTAREHEAFVAATGSPLIQQYGMTETLFMTMNIARAASKPRSVGAPRGCRLSICDADGNECPPGTTGALRVQSPSCFGSYFRQPVLTTAAYRDGWFHTGDLGYRDVDGDLFLTGRASQLIKRAGHTISPTEIDAVLRDCPGVLATVTIGLPDSRYGEEVYSLVVTNASISEADVLTHCRAQLPASHLPRRCFLIADLPTTSNGKIDMTAAREIVEGRICPSRPTLKPHS